MNKLLLGAASLTIASAMIANATVVTTSVGIDLPSKSPGPAFDLNAVWDLTGPLVMTPLGPTVNWGASITPSFVIPGATIGFLISGEHLVNPHPGESLIPPPIFAGGIAVPNILGANGLTQGPVVHTGAMHSPADYWTVTGIVIPYNPLDFGFAPGTPGPSPLQMNINVRAWHTAIPEPGSYAMIAGLGLVGFAAFRRMRA